MRVRVVSDLGSLRWKMISMINQKKFLNKKVEKMWPN